MDQNVRPDFFEGQYLGAEDLDGIVDYDRVQRARHGLGAHTWGIACGLELRERKLPTGDVEVSVLPGIAWDGYYRTIAVLAPAVITADKFANFLADTPADGQLIKVWLRYAETPSRPPAPGFEICRPDGTYSRIVESFAIEVGEPTGPVHGPVNVAGRTMEARAVKSAFQPGAADLFDESVAQQAFPLTGNRPLWLIPIGYVRWLKTAGNPGRLIPRNNSGAGGNPPDSDLIRAIRQYVGVIAEGVIAADGLIRLRDRAKDPDPSISHVRPPRVAVDPKKPPENDLVWVEGNLHVLGDARVSGGKLEFRNNSGVADAVPLAIRRVEPNALGGKDLQVVLGADNTPAGAHVFAVGPGKIDAATGQLKPDLSKRFVVRDDGTVGVGIDAPPQLFTLGGDKNTRLEFGRISASLPWSSTNASKNGDGSFAINQQSQGSGNSGADFVLMRDRRQRLVLLDHNTAISSQAGDIIAYVNLSEAGELEVLRINQAGNVGIGTPTPAATLEINGDIALDKIPSGGARPLPVNATLIWNDGTWLRLNQNRDFGKPIFGVHTPGLFASGSLNIGGAGGWTDPGAGNVHVAGTTTLEGHTTVNAQMTINGVTTVTGATTINGATTVNGATHVNGSTTLDGATKVIGSFNVTGGTKNFLIPHPVSPVSRQLVHACLEGPEAGVYYRGEAQLENGSATIVLPAYFEALTRSDDRSVLLTAMFERDDEPVSVLAASRVKNGRFTVRQIGGDNASQRFWWEVKAIRADLPPLRTEIDGPLHEHGVLAGVEQR